MDLSPSDPVLGPPLACSLCGVALREPGLWKDEEKWLASAELLSDPDEEFEAREVHYRAGKRPGVAPFAPLDGPPSAIRRDAAVVREPTRCIVVADGREVRPNWGARFEADNVPVSQLYSIAVHAACTAIAARVARQPRPGVHLSSLRTLWKVLRTRFDARDYELMASVDVPGPSMVVLNNIYYLRSTWDAMNTPIGELSCMPFAVTDPLDIPELTSKLLPNLKPMDGRPPSAFELAFQTRFRRLPPELREHVLLFMSGPKGLPAACTRLLCPSAWRDILLEPKQLPFLWDLNADLVMAYDGEKRSQGIVPDWEELVRKLSARLTCKHEGYGGLEVANGLYNRRRIWQLAEEMYVGDHVPRTPPWPNRHQQPPAVPKYWDEDGEPIHPVVCIRRFTRRRVGLTD